MHSALSQVEQNQIIIELRQEEQAFLYLSPEKLSSEWFTDQIPHLDVHLVAIDEAHCISQWGYDFRPGYLKIAEAIKILTCPVIAVTASATAEVKKDILDLLEIPEAAQFNTGVYRENLRYHVLYSDDRERNLMNILSKIEGSSILYCKSRRACQEMTAKCLKNGIKAVYYHAGMSRVEREHAQLQWQNDNYQLMVCTNAFGMGIDKPNVRNVIHDGAPASLEAYYQEAGRAGRDNKPADVYLIAAANDKDFALKQIEQRYQPPINIAKLHQAICNKYRLAKGTFTEQIFEIKIDDFSRKIELSYMQIYYSLKLLELSGIIKFYEQSYTPSKLRLLKSANHIFQIYETYPEVEKVLKSMIRIYGADLYDQEVTVNEVQIARYAEINSEKLTIILRDLVKKGIIYYFKGTDIPVIRFLTQVPDPQKIPLKKNLIKFLKNRDIERIEKMYHYIKDETCKQQLISSYFGITLPEPCGHCSTCLKEERLTDELLQIIPEEGITLTELKERFSNYSLDHLGQMILKLIEEKKVKKIEDRLFKN